jgi:hypothetical protein
MKTHYPYPSIEQFRHVIRNVQRQAQYVGNDEDCDPIYDHLKPLPVLDYQGVTKMHGCVAHDTEILLADGSTKPIEFIKVGTNIISYNTVTNDYELDQVCDNIVQTLDKKWIKLWFSDDITLEVTEDHLIYTTNRGWVMADNLTSDDDILAFQDL